MKCTSCGKTNPEDSSFCGGCGAPLSVPARNIATEHQNRKSPGTAEPVVIPDDAAVFRQSSWAYMLPSVPWFILFGVSLAFDFFTFGILPAVFAVIFIGSRYISFRRTIYILTEKHIIIRQGSILGQQRIDLPYEDINDFTVQPGTIGRSLGYARVIFQLRDGQMVLIHYVPIASPLIHHLQTHIVPSKQDQE
jgi:membrane protein YdbS with pleckstrin-like domain